jgi:hypothetical protein
VTQRKYTVSFVTSIRCEQSDVQLAHDMGIPLSSALKQGILLISDVLIHEDPDRYTPEVHRKFLDLKGAELEEVRHFLMSEDAKRARVFSLLKAKQAKLGRKIKVWDDVAEKYRIIIESEFNPDYMTLEKVMEVSTEEHGAAPPSQLERTPGHPLVEE